MLFSKHKDDFYQKYVSCGTCAARKQQRKHLILTLRGCKCYCYGYFWGSFETFLT